MTDLSMTDLAMNERAWALADECVAHAEEWRMALHLLPSGARVIDAGINVLGGLAAGQSLARMCMGGLGHVSYRPVTIGREAWPGVQVWTDHPAASCMASQYAGWAINPDGYFAMGSGPLRAKARVERELFEKLRYEENGPRGVLVLEARTLPTDAVAEWLSAKSGVRADGLTLIVAPTASLAGGVQIVARILETGLHKMDVTGFDVTRVTSAMGSAPLAPIASSDIRAIGRTNDCILYGGHACYTINAADEELERLAQRLPSSASSDYGTPFGELFERYNRDFYKIDPMLFSPAEVWLTSAETGRTFRAGQKNLAVLRASLLGAS